MLIKQLREHAGISQEEIGERMGVGQNTVSQWETGTRTPRASVLPKLAKILNCTIDELFGVEPDRKESDA